MVSFVTAHLGDVCNTKTGTIWRVAIYASAFLVYFVYVTARFDHNDFMYAAVPFGRGALYTDVHFVQGPLTFYFLKTLALLSPSGSVYAVMRYSSVVLSFAALLLAAEGCLRNDLAKIAFVVLAAGNSFFASSATEIGSYALPLFFVACAIRLMLREPKTLVVYLFIGLCIGLAGAAKINHFVFAFPFAYFAVRGLQPVGRGGSNLAAFGAGLALGSVVLLYHFAVNPAAFVVHVIRFHAEFTPVERGMNAWHAAVSVVKWFWKWLLGGGLFQIAVATYGLWLALKAPAADRNRYFICLATLAAAFLAAFSPAFGARQYYVPVSFAASLCVALALQMEVETSPRRNRLAVLALAAVAVYQAGPLVPDILQALRTDSAVTKVEVVNRQLKASLASFDSTRCPPTLFTYSGAFAVDAGVDLAKYTEAGPFWARLAKVIPARYLDDPGFRIEHWLIYPEDYVRSSAAVKIVMTGFARDSADVREPALVQAARARGFVRLATWPSPLSHEPISVWTDPGCLRGALPANSKPQH